MRPNIDISHVKNGRVKDVAAERGITTAEAYRRIIDAGLERFEDDGPRIDWPSLQDEHNLDDDELAACQAIVDYARSNCATKDDILEHVYPDHAGESSEDWWWRKLANDVLENEGIIDTEAAKIVRVRS